MKSRRYDVVVVGAGIIGLATAMRLIERYPRYNVAVLDKEGDVAQHQTGHNSGVIHAGLYYPPGSQKAALCRTGGEMLRRFCDDHGVEYEMCGKAIVATDKSQLEGLEELRRRGEANGVAGLEIVGKERLREMEPHAAGVMALHSPNTGIVDYTAVAQALADEVRRGGEIVTGTAVHGVHNDGAGHRLETSNGDVSARHVINCAGLYADRLARSMGAETDVRIIPFRGEFFSLKAERAGLVNGLIYPVPDPNLPFLGVHLSRRMDGRVEAGPNAVLALAREGYRKTDVDVRELLGIATFPGFWRMAATHWATAVKEVRRSALKGVFARSLQMLVPEVHADDLTDPSAGVRAQAVRRNGELLQDFSIVRTRGAVHVLNAPSPAATACLAIGRHIVELAAEAFDLEE